MNHIPALIPRIALWLAFVMAITLAGVARPAHADLLTPADEQAVRATVQGQLAAFAADDANKAFSYAAPAVREAMGSAANFMAMVRNGYPVVYRPASVAFLKPDMKDGQVVQRVQMVDARGDAWLAVYTLERAGKGWLISSCTVVENKGRMA
ncbi:MAG: DUF4864 domain-containing protein [Polaromonas sp.]|nr:DUF4864 domain-containing protein [Polaromonas sp.]